MHLAIACQRVVSVLCILHHHGRVGRLTMLFIIARALLIEVSYLNGVIVTHLCIVLSLRDHVLGRAQIRWVIEATPASVAGLQLHLRIIGA